MIIENKILVLAIIIPIVLIILFPYFVMFTTSIKSAGEVFDYPPTWLPKEFTPRNYIRMWQIAPLGTYFRNSIIISLGATFLALFVAIPAAYAMARLRFRGRKVFMLLVLITQMFSPIIVLIGVYQTMAFFGLLDTHISMILTYAAFNQCFALWLLAGYFSEIPIAIEEAAYVDGATRWQIISRILIPLSLPGIVAVVIFVFIWSWNQFLIPLAFSSSLASKPLTVGLYEFIGRYKIQWHYLAGASAIATIPVIVLFLVVEKRLVKGLTAGALK